MKNPKNIKVAGAVGSVAALFFLNGCTGEGVPQEEYDDAIGDLRSAKLKVEELETQLKKAKDTPPPVAPAAADTTELDKKIDELLQETESKDAEIEKLKLEFREYKSKYRLTIRDKLVGKQVAQLVTTKETFTDVEVREITPVGLRISHSGGTGRVRFEDLEKKLQDQLGYDEEEAAEILEKELAEREAKAQAVVAAKVASAPTVEDKKAETKAALERERERLDAWVDRARDQYKALSREALALEAKKRYAESRGRVSYWGPKADAAKRKASTLDRSIRAAQKRMTAINKLLR